MKYLLPILLTLTIPEIAYCEIYKWVDKQGNVHFSDRKPGKFKAKEVRLKVNTYTSVTFESSGDTTNKNTLSKGSKKVVMYSTSWCGYCKKARAYFKKNNIAYSDYDIEKNPSAKKKYQSLGATGVPVILVGGKRMNGFSENGFKRIYN